MLGGQMPSNENKAHADYLVHLPLQPIKEHVFNRIPSQSQIQGVAASPGQESTKQAQTARGPAEAWRQALGA